MRRKAFLGDEAAAEREGIVLFDFQLAERLRRTVAELGEMSEREYMHWHRYLSVKQQQREMAEAAAAARMG
jgi:hypothetical protein